MPKLTKVTAAEWKAKFNAEKWNATIDNLGGGEVCLLVNRNSGAQDSFRSSASVLWTDRDCEQWWKYRVQPYIGMTWQERERAESRGKNPVGRMLSANEALRLVNTSTSTPRSNTFNAVPVNPTRVKRQPSAS